MKTEDFRFLYPMRVRWAEADMQGVVFNANYLLFFDVASTEYYRQVSGGNRELLKSVFDRLYVVKSTIEYLQPAHFDDEILVGVKTERLGRSSMTVNFGIFREGRHLIRGENIYVYAEDGQSLALPEDFKARVQAMEGASV